MIELDLFHASRTYAGSYEGCPPVATMVTIKVGEMTRSVGHRRHLTAIPKYAQESGVLPKYTCWAWFSEILGRNADFDGRELVVMWWSEVIPKDPYGEALEVIESNGGWETLSAGYSI